MREYADYDGLGLAELVRSKQVSAAELLEAAVTRAEAAQETLNCFSALYPDLAKSQLEGGTGDGPFAGVPFVTKDLAVEVKGAPLTNGSVAWKGNVAQRDSVLTKRYREAGHVTGIDRWKTDADRIRHDLFDKVWRLERVSSIRTAELVPRPHNSKAC